MKSTRSSLSLELNAQVIRSTSHQTLRFYLQKLHQSNRFIQQKSKKKYHDDGVLLSDAAPALVDDVLDLRLDLLGGLLVLDGLAHDGQQLLLGVLPHLRPAEGDHLGQVALLERLDEVLLRLQLVVGREELHEAALQAGLLDDVDDGRAALLILQRRQQLQQEGQRGAILRLMLLSLEN